MRAPAERADDAAEPGDRVERGIERCAADGVVDDIEATAIAVFCYVILHRHRPVIDPDRAKPLDIGLASGRAGCEHVGAEGARDLDGDMSDAAGAAMNQHFLSGMNAGAIDQPFPRGDEDQRQGCCFAHADIAGFPRQQVGIDSGILRQRALQAADAARHSIDFVAGPEIGHAVTDCFHRARKIDAEDRRQRLAGVRGLARAYLDVERVDRTRGDADQHLSRLGKRPRHGRHAECRTRGVEHCGLHGLG